MVSSRKRFLLLLTALIVLLSVALLFGCNPSDLNGVTTVPVITDETPEGTVVQFVVSFNSNGGSTVPSQKLNAHSLVTKPSDPQKDNYSFLGWYADSFLTKKWNFNSDEITSSITLYAGWKPSNRILLFNTDYSLSGNTITIDLPSDVDELSLTGKIMLSDDNYMYTVYEGTSINSLGAPLFRSNEADFTNLSYGNNSYIIYVTDPSLNYKEHFVLSINRKKVFVIRFWGLDDELILTKTCSDGESVAMPDYAPAGYDVIEWQYGTRKIRPTDRLTVQKDADLYVKCKEAVYTVKLDAQGGNVSSSTTKITYGSAFSLPVPSKEGHYFVGWRTDGNIVLTGSNGTSLNAWYYTNVNTIYAAWEAYSYTLKLRTIVNGNITETSSVGAAYGTDKTFIADSHPNLSGSDYYYYVFCGWFNGAECLSTSPEFVYKNVSDPVNVDAVWSTVTIENSCGKDGCLHDRFDVSPKKISGKTDLDFALVGEIVDFTSYDERNTHSFLRWAGDKTSSERTIRIITSANAVRLTCNWSEYELHVVSAVDSDWTVSVVNGNNVTSATLNNGVTACIPSGDTATVSATSVTGTDLTFAGWYEDENYHTLLTDSITPTCSFVMSSESKYIFAKWIDSPIKINYLGSDADPSLPDHIDISLDYRQNYCGSAFSILTNVDAGYYFGGIFTDPAGETALSDMIIPSSETNVYVKIIKTPVTVIGNIAGAGKVSYKLTEIKDGAVNVKAQKVCSLFGKTSVFDEGLTYADVLTLSASTYNGYFWLGWYYSYVDTDSSWRLLTDNNEIEIKLSGKKIAYRATWKKIETDIKVSVINDSISSSSEPGSTSYVSKMASDGSQVIVLNAKINPGFCFEGWFINRYAYDVNDSSSYVTEEKIILSYNNDLELNISELSSNYDLSTIEAHFSELESDILFLRDSPTSSEKKLVSSVDGVYNAYFTGRYEIVDSAKILYQELTVELYQLISSENLSRNEILIGSFNNVYLAGNSKKQDISGANIPGLVRSSAATYHRENNSVTYLFDMTTLYDSITVAGMEYPLLFNYLNPDQNYESSTYDNEPTTKPVAVNNTTTGEGEFADKIKISSYKTFCILEAVPAKGNVFLYWEITDNNSPLSTDESNPNPTYSTDPFVYRNDIGYLTYTAHWKTINTNDVKIFAVKNIEEAGETSVSGKSVLVSRGTYDMVIDLSASTNSGYLFLGWYDEDGNLINTEETFSFVCRDLLTYFGREGIVTYYARWAEISSHILIDEVAEYSITGFIAENGETYYTVMPVSDIYFNGNAGYYNGYYFIGWFNEDGTLFSKDYFIENQPESTFPSRLSAKWTNIPKEILPTEMMRYFENMDISAFDITVEAYGRGKATYAFSEAQNGTTVVLFYAEPNSGYKFNGWYDDSALNTESLITISSVYSSSLQELFYNNQTGRYSLSVTLYASFVSLDMNIEFDRSGVSSLYSDDSIATPTCLGYRQTGTDTLYKFNAGVKNGFVFVRWKITPSDTGVDQFFFEPDLEFSYNSSAHLNVVAVYSQITNGAEYVIKNTSEYAGSAVGFGFYLSETEKRIRFVLKPNAGFAFWKIVAESAGGSIEYIFDNNSTDWSSNGGNIVTTITDPTVTGSFSTEYKYTVYWKSIWQNATHFTEIVEYVNHNSVYLTGKMKEKAYTSGVKNYVNVYTLEADFDLDNYTFIGWYKNVQNENLTETIYCNNSKVRSFTEVAPEKTTPYFCKWGLYTVSIEMSDEEQMSSPDGYSAIVDFFTQDKRKSSHEFVSEIGFAYMDEYNDDLLSRIEREGYEYSKVDLNGAEGGKIVYLVWKKLPVSGINTTFITAVSMRDTSMPYRANVLFADESNAHMLSSVTQAPADLNFGIGQEPIYCYYSYESGYGKPIADLGVEYNGSHTGFVGRYQYCDSVDKVNVTPYSDNQTYIVYNRQETIITLESGNLIPSQKVTTIQKLSYPTQFANIGNVQAGLIFAGWYDNPETLGKPYDFSKEIFGDLTLYAKWYSLQDYNANASQVLSLGVTNAYSQNNGVFYFTALSDEIYTIVLRTETPSMTQFVTVSDMISSQTIYNKELTDSTLYAISVRVSGGNLYRVELRSASGSTSGRIELQLSGKFPDDGGTFRNLIPYLDDFSITAVPFENETFLGWFNRDGEEISAHNDVTYYGTESIYTLHDKKYSIYSFEITDNIYLYGKFNYYSMKIINPEEEAGEFRFLGDLSVGSEIELRATPRGGFAFKEWMIYDPTTGEIKSFSNDFHFITDLKTAAEESYSPEMSIYKFRMLESNLIFIVTWMTVNDNTYPPNSYVKYDIEYEEAYVNAPENRTVFYYTDPNSMTEGNNYLSTEPFVLSDPSRYEIENGVSGRYIFEGWYYRDPSGDESLYNPNSKRYVFDPAVAITHAQTGKVTVYAKWSDPVPDITVYTDETTGRQYILLGEYQSSYVDESSAEFAEINSVAEQDGYYYNRNKTRKYYKEGDMFFRVEKLRWDILRKDTETVLVQAHELFMTSQFNYTTNQNGGLYANNWENSYLREFLNGEFMTEIFNAFEINLIKKKIASVNNKPETGSPSFDDKTTYPWVAQNNTEDYIYVLSYVEASNIMYGFNASADKPCDLRSAGYTEYYDMILTNNEQTKGYYWLRSPGSNETNVFVVDDAGRILLDKNVTYNEYGIRPVMKLLNSLVFD